MSGCGSISEMDVAVGKWSPTLSLLRDAAAVVGVAYATQLAVRKGWQLLSGFRAYFLAPRGLAGLDLKRYGPWAVVTGASEGIGRCYALELARRGLNVVIMSRSQEKLQRVADEIREKYGREVRVIVVDFSKGQEIYPQLEEQLRDLDIGVLVNNVGMSHPQGPDWFLSVRPEALYNLVTINCQATVQLTHMLLPRMLEKKRGIVVNLSTLGAQNPCAFLAVYVASKVFVNYFSDALRVEYGSRGIVVQCVMPGMVATAMSHVRRPTYGRPTPEVYTREAIATIGVQDTTFGYWPHAFQCFIFNLFPRSLFRHLSERAMNKARLKLAARRAATATTQA